MAEASSSASADGGLLMPFSCFECRNRKLKCDRLKEQCTRCAQCGSKCQYPTSRKKQVITVTRPKVKELEARLKDLEYRLKSNQENPPASSNPSPSSFQDELVETGRFEQLPPQNVIEELTNFYFSNLYSDWPIIHPSRYIASLYLPPHMQPPMCLQYAIMALAATHSSSHSQMAQAFYRRARYYFEADELKGAGEHFVTLAHVQCCVLLGQFEVKNMWFSRAAINTSKAVRLAQILGLDHLDGNSGLGPTLPPPKDWCEQEERRRTMWGVFNCDKHTSSTTGWPSLIDAKRIKTLLPASEEAYQVSIEEPSLSFNEALVRDDKGQCSVFACKVLVCYLFHECLDHTYQDYPDPNPESAQGSAFWKRHQDLNNELATTFVTLPEILRNPESNTRKEAVSINLQLHVATICLHRIGVARAKKYAISPEILSGTQLRLLPAAEEIFRIVASVADVSGMFRNPLVAFAAYMAGFVFMEDFLDARSSQSEAKMGALMDLMVAIGHQNMMTASLAIQMAHALRRTGVDPRAVEKVTDLMVKTEMKGPLMGKPNQEAGSVVFCPFEAPAGPEGLPSSYPTGV
ncbi:binuclear zinc transcription factor [Thelonectria olida]|uniref:Binuclear zinc transcription factor n=1 Tax=Thelonectria olida TaxID=1576542 RepID=A0A9P8W018_9HYPO|nr:binuclear zinc transcription factor [Thelonectria olida]